MKNMETRSFNILVLALLIVPFVLAMTGVQAQLSTDFYKNTCPNVESIVSQVVANKFQQTFVTAPATLRLLFHDCFVRVSGLIAFPNTKTFVLLRIIYFLTARIYVYNNIIIKTSTT